MKKKILAIVTTLFMVLTFVGCNTQGLSLVNEFKKASAWEALQESGNIEFSIKAAEETVKLSATYEAFSNSKELQMDMTLTPTVLEVSGAKMDLTTGNYKISPVKVYMDGLKFYISTSYITDIARIAGVDASSMVDVSKDYIALDLSDAVKASGVDAAGLTKSPEAAWEMYEKMNINLPITQEDRKYTIDLTSDQMVDALFNLVIETFNTQESTMRETYKAMGLSDEEIDQVLASVKEVYNDDTKAQVKPFVKGSTAKAVYSFEDDKYSLDLKADFKVTMDTDAIEINLAVTDSVQKAAKKAMTFPTNVKVYTMSDIEKLMASEMAAESTVQVAKSQTFTQGGKVYVPVKSTLQSAGLEVQYDAATKAVTVKGTNTVVPVVIKGNTSYTTVEFLQTLGVTCEIQG